MTDIEYYESDEKVMEEMKLPKPKCPKCGYERYCIKVCPKCHIRMNLTNKKEIK